MRFSSLQFLAAFALAGSPLWGATLATATYDADSYIFVGTNKEFDLEISINAHREPDEAFPVFGHFNFGFIRFDLTGVPREGRKYLSVELLNFIVIPEDQPLAPPARTDTGEAVVHVVAPPRGDYFSPSVAKGDWYRLFVFEQPKVGTFNFAATEGVGTGRYTIDVTDIVNAWLDGTAENHGFALWAETGGVELGSTEGAAFAGTAIAPELTSEPVVEELTYADWATARWGDLWVLSPDNSPSSDRDLDGFSNLAEYAWDRNPDAPETLPLPAPTRALDAATGEAVWTFPLGPAGRSDARFIIETRENLAQGSPFPFIVFAELDGQDGATAHLTTDNQLQLRVPATARRFFRLGVAEAGALAQ